MNELAASADLGSISAASRLHLGRISAASRPYLGCISHLRRGDGECSRLVLKRLEGVQIRAAPGDRDRDRVRARVFRYERRLGIGMR